MTNFLFFFFYFIHLLCACVPLTRTRARIFGNKKIKADGVCISSTFTLMKTDEGVISCAAYSQTIITPTLPSKMIKALKTANFFCSAKGVVWVIAARVQIPASPPKTPETLRFRGFSYMNFYVVKKPWTRWQNPAGFKRILHPRYLWRTSAPHRLIHRHAKVTTTAAAQRIPKTINPMRSSPSTAAKSCRNRMCRQGRKYAVWVDLFHGDRKICCRQQRFRKKCTKIPGSLTLPGIFSCTPGRSRTCDLQSRSWLRERMCDTYVWR